MLLLFQASSTNTVVRWLLVLSTRQAFRLALTLKGVLRFRLWAASWAHHWVSSVACSTEALAQALAAMAMAELEAMARVEQALAVNGKVRDGGHLGLT